MLTSTVQYTWKKLQKSTFSWSAWNRVRITNTVSRNAIISKSSTITVLQLKSIFAISWHLLPESWVLSAISVSMMAAMEAFGGTSCTTQATYGQKSTIRTFITVPIKNAIHLNKLLKGIVSRDFEWLQMISMNRLCVPDVPLEVYAFLNLHLHTVFYF